MTTLLLEPMPSVTETLRERLQAASDDVTLYRIAKDTGVSWNTLNRFLGGAGLRSEQVDKLADYFKLHLAPGPADEKPTKRRR